MQPEQLHADQSVVTNAAEDADRVATSIDGHLATLQPTVDTVLASGWAGGARDAFETAYEEWKAGVVKLAASLRELGGNTMMAGQDFDQADQAARQRISQVQSMGAFDGALKS